MSCYTLYFDSGTSNTRAYLLDGQFNVRCVGKRSVGSKDSAIAGSNRVLIDGMKELYDEVIAAAGITEDEIGEIYASGMITSPYGLKEVPHSIVPQTVESFAKELYCFREESRFGRDIWLVPGLKTVNEDFSFVGNMRGEEIEIIGTLDELAQQGIATAAMIFPGSHTHVTYVKNGEVADILSNMSGEIFHAVKNETILSPVLSIEVDRLDKAMVKQGYENLVRFGFNRALYICHAMRILEHGTREERYSYAEGVINGGLRQSLEYACANRWTDCDTAVIVADKFMYSLFEILFEDSPYIKKLVWLPISKNKSYAVNGLKKILEIKNK